jgi:hypothetical protein
MDCEDVCSQYRFHVFFMVHLYPHLPLSHSTFISAWAQHYELYHQNLLYPLAVTFRVDQIMWEQLIRLLRSGRQPSQLLARSTSPNILMILPILLPFLAKNIGLSWGNTMVTWSTNLCTDYFPYNTNLWVITIAICGYNIYKVMVIFVEIHMSYFI